MALVESKNRGASGRRAKACIVGMNGHSTAPHIRHATLFATRPAYAVTRRGDGGYAEN